MYFFPTMDSNVQFPKGHKYIINIKYTPTYAHSPLIK